MPKKVDVMSEKEYIGDGVYVDFDGFGVVMTTENGIEVQNTVYLEPNVMKNLIAYYSRMVNK